MATSECQTYNRPVLKGIDNSTSTIYLYQPRCKMWSCPYCAILNQQTWCARIAEGIRYYWEQGDETWSFFTVTSHRKLRNRQQTLYVWPKAWAKLSRRMRYHFRPLRYALLPEQHKDGRLHIHAMANVKLTKSWLKTNTASCGLGHQADVEVISEPRLSVRYTTKYLSKSAKDQQWPRGFRRVRASQRWPALEDDPTFVKMDIEWHYLTTYPSDGLDYLAGGVRKSTGLDVKVL